MRTRALAAGLDCRLEHRIEPLGRDDELGAVGVVARDQRTAAREALLEGVEDLPGSATRYRSAPRRRTGPSTLRRTTGGSLAACGPVRQAPTVAVPGTDAGATTIHRCRTARSELRQERRRAHADRLEPGLGGCGLVLPRRRPIVGIDVVGIVRAHRQHELHVALGYRGHRPSLTSRSVRLVRRLPRVNRAEQAGGADGRHGRQDNSHRPILPSIASRSGAGGGVRSSHAPGSPPNPR